eukprot:PhF_6_TR18895/c0_g1_i1/m.27532
MVSHTYFSFVAIFMILTVESFRSPDPDPDSTMAVATIPPTYEPMPTDSSTNTNETNSPTTLVPTTTASVIPSIIPPPLTFPNLPSRTPTPFTMLPTPIPSPTPSPTPPPQTPTPSPFPPCTVSRNCSDHAFSVYHNTTSGKCMCRCRNYWGESMCESCPKGYRGSDCDQCPLGTVRPLCRPCSLEKDCGNHGIRVEVNREGTTCMCSCRNQWTGFSCDQCDTTKYSGSDCDRCSFGLTKYPECILPSTMRNMTDHTIQCQDRCGSIGCTGSAVSKILEDVGCSCSNCTSRLRRRSCLSLDNSHCDYPKDRCLRVRGEDKCMMKNSTGYSYVPCKIC